MPIPIAPEKRGTRLSPRTKATVHIAFGCDLRYLQPFAVALRSVAETARDPRRLHFWLVTTTLDETTVRPAVAAAIAAGSRFTLLPLSTLEPLVKDLPARGHISTAAYYRLFLPEMVPRTVQRMVYLDCDLVVRRSIEELWETDLEDNPIAAVVKPRAQEFTQVGLRAETDYFNSGVMVLDLARWRDCGIRKAALEFVANHPGRIHGHDQPALNHVLDGRWRRLDPRWNQQFKFFVHTAGYLGMERHELRRVRREPYIIHYTTGAKPWLPGNDHPLRHRYFEVLDRTPFAGWRPERGSLKERTRFLMWRWVPHYLRPHVLRNVYRPQYHALKDRLGLRR